MKPSLSTIDSLVSQIKEEIFFKIDKDEELHKLMSASAYDTAWLAMVPLDKLKTTESDPMFPSCLKWILDNQNEEGFWGETTEDGLPTIDSLTSTIACLLALHKWNLGCQHMQSGMSFMKSKAEIVLKINYQNLPQWFLLTFPGLIELAEAVGLPLDLPPGLTAILPDIFARRQHILQTDGQSLSGHDHSRNNCPPLALYLETTTPVPQGPVVDRIIATDKGPVFRSPSATAAAYMATGNMDCLKYLQSLVQTFPDGGVPGKYPSDADMIRMLIVEELQGLGLAEHFGQEINRLLAQVFRNREEKKPNLTQPDTAAGKLFKDAMAFRLLRTQGYSVNPSTFCWFLHEPELLMYMEENREQFISTMYSVYRATDLLFPKETEMEEARTFAVSMLHNSHARNRDLNMLISKGLHNMIRYELNVPWSARLDRLYHRKYIEENVSMSLWMGKTSFYRLSSAFNKKLTKLAVQNYEYQQSIYGHELEELKGWSKKWGLSEMGFGREKTVYTYFAVAATSCFPCSSIMRVVIAKSAIIVTVADDFYDEHGSLGELENLTEAVKKWDGGGLNGHGKTIFDVLDHFVNDVAATCCHEERRKKILLIKLREIWCETFKAWMVERSWSLTGYLPSMESYLKTGMVSIAAHTVALPATSLLSTSDPSNYSEITKLLMALCRLMNDIQSYQKEEVDGKINLVLLHLKENPTMKIEDSIAHVEHIIAVKRKEFLRHVFMDDDMPESCKQVHLSCMKVFNMFFNCTNLFDSETALVEDIKKAIYLPIQQEPIAKPFLKPSPTTIPSQGTRKASEVTKISSGFRKRVIRTNFIKQPLVVKNSCAGGRIKTQNMTTRFQFV